MNGTPPSDPNDFEDPLSNYEPTQYRSELHRVLAEEAIDDMQSTPSAQVTVDTSIRGATKMLSELKVSSLLVVKGETLVGIFTARDVLEKVAENYAELADQPVGEVMSADPTVVYETDPVGMALAGIAVAGHRHVPVLKVDGSVLGIVSPKRVLRHLSPYLN
ncbi:CBS domain protein [Stieleria neptunia]|uniref:CBS domain protein n=1 Tax=Stieleria neptunia TaxID=2527979 RepID=A0A518HHG5_9BACT|nr:CBS domain-containing protein [Stieleria neptunia]QDV40286.1 CBS domain protein [Stieleria neptunia]